MDRPGLLQRRVHRRQKLSWRSAGRTRVVRVGRPSGDVQDQAGKAAKTPGPGPVPSSVDGRLALVYCEQYDLADLHDSGGAPAARVARFRVSESSEISLAIVLGGPPAGSRVAMGI